MKRLCDVQTINKIPQLQNQHKTEFYFEITLECPVLHHTAEGCSFRAEQVTSIIISLIAWRTICTCKNRTFNKPSL